MMVQFCFAFLALFAVTAASDPDCEELVKPLMDRSRVVGKWIFYVATSENEVLLKEIKSINSSWIELKAIPDSDDMTLRWGDKLNGKCYTGGVNTTFSENSTTVAFTFNNTRHEHFGKHLVTCPDCILWIDSVVQHPEAKKGRSLYLFTKSGTLEDSQLEEFKKQAVCLNMPSDFHFPGAEDLCPDEQVAASDVKEEE